MSQTSKRNMKTCPSKPGIPPPVKKVEPENWNFGHRTRNFRRVSDIQNIRDALRTKITENYRNQYNVMLKVGQKTNLEEAKMAEQFHKQIEPVNVQWQDSCLQGAMSKLEALQKACQVTEKLQKRRDEIDAIKYKVNMQIIFLESELARFTVFQNFLYLMREFAWRQDHDWIHRTKEGDLEAYPESIEKRMQLFVRFRNNDDALESKKFFFECYEPIRHEILLPFISFDDFQDILQYSKSRTVRGLLELHLVMWDERNIVQESLQFDETSAQKLKQHKEKFETRTQQNYFTQERTKILEEEAMIMVDKNLLKSIQRRVKTKIEPVLDAMLSSMLPKTEKDSKINSLSALEKVAYIETLLQNLLTTIDKIPVRILHPIEAQQRKRKVILDRKAVRACDLEHQMDTVLKNLKKNLEPPFQRVPPPKPLPRSRLPPRPKKPIPKPATPTLREKIFIEAFTDHAMDDMDLSKPEYKKILNQIETSCMPFYFDHYLELQGYVPIKDFVPQIEIREGKEENRFRYKKLIPAALERVKHWVIAQEHIKKYNISQTGHLYK